MRKYQVGCIFPYAGMIRIRYAGQSAITLNLSRIGPTPRSVHYAILVPRWGWAYYNTWLKFVNMVYEGGTEKFFQEML